MTITAKNIAKRYNRNTIFQNFSYQFKVGHIYAVLGPNGSGKSTLLKILASMIEPDEGKIEYFDNYTDTTIYQTLGFVSPYIDIPEEYTYLELLAFQSKFRTPLLPVAEIPSNSGLAKFANTAIKEFSSGMKQRVKLALILFFKNDLKIFDEPCSHLDEAGFGWFNDQLREFAQNSVVLIGSNNPKEYELSEFHIDIQSFK